MKNQNSLFDPETKEPPSAGRTNAVVESGAQPPAKPIKLAGMSAPYPIHPACALFPELPPDQLQALAKSIREQKQLAPIIMLDGQVLDGRSRLAACRIADVNPWIVDAADVPAFKKVNRDPFEYAVAMNLSRRHLSESERAMIAAKIATLRNGQHKQAGPIGPAAAEKKSIDDAAQLLNVSSRSVKRAKKVQESGTPELVKAVDQRQVSVSAAADVATLPATEQKAVVEAGPEHVRKAAQAVRQEKVTRKPKGLEHSPDQAWQKMCALAESVERCAAEMASLNVNQQWIQAITLCEGLAEKFSKLALKFGGKEQMAVEGMASVAVRPTEQPPYVTATVNGQKSPLKKGT